MANVTIAGLPALAAVADAMIFEVESLGANRKATHAQIKADILDDPSITGDTTFFSDFEIVEELGNAILRNTSINAFISIYGNDGGVDTLFMDFDVPAADIVIPTGITLNFSAAKVGQIYNSGSDFYIDNAGANADIHIRVTDGVSTESLIFFDGSTKRVAIGQDFVTPLGLFHAKYDLNAEIPLIERETTAITNAQSVFKFICTSVNNMTDGFGPMCTFVIQDDALVQNIAALFGGVRDGADNSGALIFGTYAAGVPAEQLKIASDGGIFMSNLLGAAPGANPDVYWDSVSSELFYNSSSIKYKENVVDAEFNDIAWIYQSRVRKYGRKLQPEITNEIGFVAEELDQVKPEYVGKKLMNINEINQALHPIGDEEPKEPPDPIYEIDSVSLSAMMPSVILALQLQDERLKALEAK